MDYEKLTIVPDDKQTEWVTEEQKKKPEEVMEEEGVTKKLKGFLRLPYRGAGSSDIADSFSLNPPPPYALC